MTTSKDEILSNLLNAIEGWEIKPHPDDALCAAMDAARVFLARQNSAHQPIRVSEPQPPAADEVAELVEWLEETGHLAMEADVQEGERYFRAAELLEHQASPTRLVLQPSPELVAVGWCRSDELENAMNRGWSFKGWRDQGAGANQCDVRLYVSQPPTLPSGKVE